MVKRKWTKAQIKIYKILHRKLKNPIKHGDLNADAPNR
jgi:hypothetical protein